MEKGKDLSKKSENRKLIETNSRSWMWYNSLMSKKSENRKLIETFLNITERIILLLEPSKKSENRKLIETMIRHH